MAASKALLNLRLHFTTVKDLNSYLKDILTTDGLIDFQPQGTDSIHYANLINTSYVGTNEPAAPDTYVPCPVMIPMREIIDKAQERLLGKKGGKNIITAGYCLAHIDNAQSRRVGHSIAITNTYLNTIVTSLQRPEWETLLERIGSNAMLHLLTKTSVFVSLPNDCLCQMTGFPLMDIVAPQQDVGGRKRKASGPIPGDREPKRARLLTQTPADVLVPRTRIFYARPTHVFETSRIAVGLPPHHILNRICCSYNYKQRVSPTQYTDPDPKEQTAHVRHLSKYVFPRQYRLSTPFGAHSPRALVMDYTDRETEINTKGRCKTPPRLRNMLDSLDKLLWMHTKCRYKSLRDITCPSKIPHEGPLDSSVILELMAERHSQTQSQTRVDANNSVDSFGDTIAPCGLTQAVHSAANKPRFLEFSSTHVEVYRYVAVVTKSVIPKSFWGCDANLKLVLEHVMNLITCRRYETLTLHHILQGFKTCYCDWLIPPGEAMKEQSRVSVTDAIKRRQLLEDFIYWYFDSFVLSLLKTTFYVTESAALRGHVLYFRHDDWQTLCSPLITCLTTNTFEKISKTQVEEAVRQSQLGFSFIRLLPKETGVRPIANLRRKILFRLDTSNVPQSINQILQAAFLILKYEQHTQPALLGASVFSPNEIYTRLRSLQTRLPRSSSGQLPKLYFVKLDVQACFDTIEQIKLLRILKEIISEDEYTIRRYGQMTLASDKPKRIYAKKAMPDYEHPHFLDYAAKLAASLRSAIFVDQVVYATACKADILQLLEQHITDNLVKIGGDYYRQVIGIPQGSILSALLCNFFYGDLERKSTWRFSEDLDSVLLRWMDDYLYVTADLNKAQEFLDMMKKGHPEYGCFIARDKTLTNFDHGIDVMNVTDAQQQSFPWCGYNINMTNLSVSVDYSKFQDIGIVNTLSVNRGRAPGAAFKSKMLRMAKQRSHIIYCDANLNTEHTVGLNVYQNFLICAMKMHGYLKTWGIDPSKKQHASFIYNTIREMFRYAYFSMKGGAGHGTAIEMKARFALSQAVVIWLGFHAFHAVLSKKAHQYQALLRQLAFELSRPQQRRIGRRFRVVVKEGMADVVSISY